LKVSVFPCCSSCAVPLLIILLKKEEDSFETLESTDLFWLLWQLTPGKSQVRKWERGSERGGKLQLWTAVCKRCSRNSLSLSLSLSLTTGDGTDQVVTPTFAGKKFFCRPFSRNSKKSAEGQSGKWKRSIRESSCERLTFKFTIAVISKMSGLKYFYFYFTKRRPSSTNDRKTFLRRF
jgi:hypothetical protein